MYRIVSSLANPAAFSNRKFYEGMWGKKRKRETEQKTMISSFNITSNDAFHLVCFIKSICFNYYQLFVRFFVCSTKKRNEQTLIVKSNEFANKSILIWISIKLNFVVWLFGSFTVIARNCAAHQYLCVCVCARGYSNECFHLSKIMIQFLFVSATLWLRTTTLV